MQSTCSRRPVRKCETAETSLIKRVVPRLLPAGKVQLVESSKSCTFSAGSNLGTTRFIRDVSTVSHFLTG